MHLVVGRAPARWGLLALAAFQLALLAPELRLAPFPLNDDALHLAAALEGRDRLGGPAASTLDPWLPFWTLGYPLWHAYQPLAHLGRSPDPSLQADDGVAQDDGQRSSRPRSHRPRLAAAS